MTSVQIIHLAASVLFLGAAFVLVSYRMKFRKAGLGAHGNADTARMLQAMEERLDARFRAQIDLLNQQNKAMANIESQVTTLADERLVEQAISIARMGGNPEHISTAVGMSMDEAKTLHRYRSI